MPLRQSASVLALAHIFLSVSAAHAQDEGVAERNGSDGIVVIGERVGVGNLRASAVVTTDDIEDRPLGADITQSLQRVPGVQVSTGDARGGTFSFELYMRGLNKEQVGLSLDGIPTGDARFNGGSPPQRFIESSNISRIEVSQSAGDIGSPSRFALGGFVNFISADPYYDTGATIEAGFGDNDFYRGYVRLDTGEIAPGLTSYLSYSHQENDIWAGPRARSSRRDHVEFKAVKDFDDGGFIKLRAAYNDQRDNDFNIITLGEFEADPRNDRATDEISGIPAIDVDYGGALGGTREDFLVYLNTRFMMTDTASFSLNPYFQSLRGESFRYQDRQRRLAGGDPRAVTGYNDLGGAIRPGVVTTRDSNAFGGPADMRVTPRDTDRYGLTGEVRLEDVIAGNTIRIGGWWETTTSSETRNFYPILNSAESIDYNRGDLAFVEYDRESRIETAMLYAQDSIEVIPDVLRLDAGLTWFNIRYRARSPLEYRTLVGFSQDSGINPKIGIGFRPAEGIEVFGGYAQNFAGIPEDAFLGSNAAINPGDLDPIETENFDIGIRYSNETIALVLQGFHTRLKNNIGIIPRTTTGIDPDEIVRGNVATQAANIDGTKSSGIEATAILDFDFVDFYLSYAYQDAKHDDPPVGSAERAALASVGVIGGARVRDIPEHSVFGQVSVEPVEGLRLQGTGRYISDRVGGHILFPNSFAEIGTEEIPGYTVFGAVASYDFGDTGPFQELRFQLNVDNVFDKEYIGAVSSATATLPEFGLFSGPDVRTLDRYFIGAPRTFTASLRARF
ncbi:TonB-dependent receptor [Novosphingobium aquimarinum]|uniref:TonB-dependent receptor n=1 Tax=Novosphingobium aquimarinum TaxID=2682494 RepID=UPI0012EB4684|nr:TonB-dependent receptor [Novosphingobium aquimarinum]